MDYFQLMGGCLEKSSNQAEHNNGGRSNNRRSRRAGGLSGTRGGNGTRSANGCGGNRRGGRSRSHEGNGGGASNRGRQAGRRQGVRCDRSDDCGGRGICSCASVIGVVRHRSSRGRRASSLGGVVITDRAELDAHVGGGVGGTGEVRAACDNRNETVREGHGGGGNSAGRGGGGHGTRGTGGVGAGVCSDGSCARLRCAVYVGVGVEGEHTGGSVATVQGEVGAA